MPLKNYGVLKGKAIKAQMGQEHYQILMEDKEKTKYRIAVNVLSKQYPSEVLYIVIGGSEGENENKDFQPRNRERLCNLKSGFTKIKDSNNPVIENIEGIALDYSRGELPFKFSEMRPLKATVPGPDNDLNEKLDKYIGEAIKNNSTIYAFGERWPTEPNNPDKYFNFTPGNGVHDIHMNQGSVGKFAKSNGIWQDGGLLIHNEKTNKWVGIFLAFQSQSLPTDKNGNAI